MSFLLLQINSFDKKKLYTFTEIYLYLYLFFDFIKMFIEKLTFISAYIKNMKAK